MMIRTAVMITACAGLVACGDGLGSQYSSARAERAAQTYIPITPGATPVGVPGAQQVQPGGTVVAPAVLTAPIAITPGATPVTPTAAEAALYAQPDLATASAQAPGQSVRPNARGSSAALVTPAAVRTPQPAPRASNRGVIFDACRQSGRGEATRSRCGCIQTVADQQLTRAQQNRGAGYFRDNAKLQETRQSDRAADEKFWKAWRGFSEVAARQCRGS